MITLVDGTRDIYGKWKMSRTCFEMRILVEVFINISVRDANII